MPVQDIQRVLPSLRVPGREYAHLTNDKLNREIAYCGHRRASGHSHHVLHFNGEKLCSCGAPICPACLAVRESYINTGAWEGPEWRS